MAGQIELAKYVAKIEADMSSLSRGLEQADTKIKESIGNMSQKFGQGFKDLGSKMEGIGKSVSKVSLPLAGIGIAALKVGSDFQAMQMVAC